MRGRAAYLTAPRIFDERARAASWQRKRTKNADALLTFDWRLIVRCCSGVGASISTHVVLRNDRASRIFAQDAETDRQSAGCCVGCSSYLVRRRRGLSKHRLNCAMCLVGGSAQREAAGRRTTNRVRRQLIALRPGQMVPSACARADYGTRKTPGQRQSMRQTLRLEPIVDQALGRLQIIRIVRVVIPWRRVVTCFPQGREFVLVLRHRRRRVGFERCQVAALCGAEMRPGIWHAADDTAGEQKHRGGKCQSCLERLGHSTWTSLRSLDCTGSRRAPCREVVPSYRSSYREERWSRAVRSATA